MSTFIRQTTINDGQGHIMKRTIIRRTGDDNNCPHMLFNGGSLLRNHMEHRFGMHGMFSGHRMHGNHHDGHRMHGGPQAPQYQHEAVAPSKPKENVGGRVAAGILSGGVSEIFNGFKGW
ncbi:MAG: hypothetical protein A2039_04390 [Candidatus Melainabacteria bacterium GWA2_34_9]|nr:MAG: hypothetical protein A2039_04390 [Candidatus Melainabacteria bacterium GWA2_34_9]